MKETNCNQSHEPKYYEFLVDGRLQEAKEHCLQEIKKSCSFDEEKSHKMGLCHILNELGDYEESEKILTQLLRKRFDYRVLHNLGAVKRMKGDLREALEIFQKEAEELDHKDSLSLATNFYELAKTKHMLGFLDDALMDALECFKHTRGTDDPIMKGCSYRILGDLFSEYNCHVAEKLFKKARYIFIKRRDPKAVADIDVRIDCLRQGKSPKFIS